MPYISALPLFLSTMSPYLRVLGVTRHGPPYEGLTAASENGSLRCQRSPRAPHEGAYGWLSPETQCCRDSEMTLLP